VCFVSFPLFGEPNNVGENKSLKCKGTFNNCEAYGNESGGVSVMTNGDPTVTGCKFYDNKGTGIDIRSGGKGTYERNTLSGNGKGNWLLHNPGTVHRIGNMPNE